MREAYGVQFSLATPSDLQRAEASLTDVGVGAVHWLEPWSVSDPGALVSTYADLFVKSGGRIYRGDAETLCHTARRGWSVRTHDGSIDAGAAVVALGPWSPDLLDRFGYRFPMVRKRGYHRHYKGGDRLNLPLCDGDEGYCIAPMAKGLRITTGVELAKPDGPPDLKQLTHAEHAARQLMNIGAPIEREPWIGTRHSCLTCCL